MPQSRRLPARYLSPLIMLIIFLHQGCSEHGNAYCRKEYELITIGDSTVQGDVVGVEVYKFHQFTKGCSKRYGGCSCAPKHCEDESDIHACKYRYLPGFQPTECQLPNKNSAPWLSIIRPTDFQEFSSATKIITIEVMVRDAEGSVSTLDITAKGLERSYTGEDLTVEGGGYLSQIVSWDTEELEDGVYTITAEATDDENFSKRESVRIRIGETSTPSNSAPDVSLLAPSEATNELTVGETFILKANADDPDEGDNIEAVVFYKDGESIGNGTLKGTTYELTWTVTGTAAEHSITAKATDNNSNTGTSEAVKVTFVDPEDDEPVLEGINTVTIKSFKDKSGKDLMSSVNPLDPQTQANTTMKVFVSKGDPEATIGTVKLRIKYDKTNSALEQRYSSSSSGPNGNVVRTISLDGKGPGEYTLIWDGKDGTTNPSFLVGGGYSAAVEVVYKKKGIDFLRKDETPFYINPDPESITLSGEMDPSYPYYVAADNNKVFISLDLITGYERRGFYVTDETKVTFSIIEENVVISALSKAKNQAGGEASLSSTEVYTSNGRAYTILTTPTQSGKKYRVQARVDNLHLDGKKVEGDGTWTFETDVIEGIPGSPDDISIQAHPAEKRIPADMSTYMKITATAKDKFGNPMPDYRQVFWYLDGLGNVVSSNEYSPEGVYSTTITSGGRSGTQSIVLNVGNELEVVEIENNELDINLSAQHTVLFLKSSGFAQPPFTTTIAAKCLVKGKDGQILGQPAPGTPVHWITSNGEISDKSSQVNENGNAETTLSTDDGRIGRAIIGCTIGEVGNTMELEFRLPSREGYTRGFTIDNPVIVGDDEKCHDLERGIHEATTHTGMVEQLDDEQVKVPYHTYSRVTVSGKPNEEVKIYGIDQVYLRALGSDEIGEFVPLESQGTEPRPIVTAVGLDSDGRIRLNSDGFAQFMIYTDCHSYENGECTCNSTSTIIQKQFGSEKFFDRVLIAEYPDGERWSQKLTIVAKKSFLKVWNLFKAAAIGSDYADVGMAEGFATEMVSGQIPLYPDIRDLTIESIRSLFLGKKPDQLKVTFAYLGLVADLTGIGAAVGNAIVSGAKIVLTKIKKAGLLVGGPIVRFLRSLVPDFFTKIKEGPVAFTKWAGGVKNFLTQLGKGSDKYLKAIDQSIDPEDLGAILAKVDDFPTGEKIGLIFKNAGYEELDDAAKLATRELAHRVARILPRLKKSVLEEIKSSDDAMAGLTGMLKDLKFGEYTETFMTDEDYLVRILNSDGYIHDFTAGDFLTSKLSKVTLPKLGKVDVGKYNPNAEGIHRKIFDDYYQETFSNLRANKTGNLTGNVEVHHAVPQVFERVFGIMSKEELHSIENLRGIPRTIPELNRKMHQSWINRMWNGFIVDNETALQNGTLKKEKLLEFAKFIDEQVGFFFWPPRGAGTYY